VAIESDVAIIGGGVGGYVGAIRAAQLGARVVLIEKDHLGGTCLNRGCIPSKALLDAARRYEDLQHAEEFGLKAESIGFDYPKVLARKQKVVDQLRSGVEALVKGNGITYVHGMATFKDSRRLAVKIDDGSEQEVVAKNFVIATGSVEGRPPIPGLDLPGIIGSTEGLVTAPPESVIVAGGGPIGVEFATVFAAFGSKVTVIEMMPTLLPLEDVDLGKGLAQQFERRGIQVRVGSKLEEIRAAAGGYDAVISGATGSETLHADKLLVAMSRAPFTSGLGLDRLGMEMMGRSIKVDTRMKTNVAGVYAIGDVVGGGLAHVAMAQGEVAVENALGHDSEMDYRAVPSVTFCHPQVASVGLSEEKAAATSQTLKIGRYPFVAASKAVVVGEPAGFVKVVAEAKYGQILGVHMIGPDVTDLIAEAALSIMMEATIEDIAHTIHAHPTLPEAYKESTLDVDRRAIHIMKRRR
jgi:dihydrolipoamide dehydrogenase